MLENLRAQLKQDAKARFRVLRTTVTGGAVSSDPLAIVVENIIMHASFCTIASERCSSFLYVGG